MRTLKTVLLHLTQMNAEAFFAEESTVRFLSTLKAAGIHQQLFSVSAISDFFGTMGLNKPVDDRIFDQLLLITDDPEYSRSLSKSCPDLCILGLVHSDALYETELPAFTGAASILLSLEDLSVSYLEMVLCHVRHIPFTIAESDRLIIRESTLADYPALRPLFDELPENPFNMQDDPTDTLLREQYEAYVHSAYSFYGYGLWSLVLRSTGRVIGWCGFSADEPPHLGYVIHPDFRRKGYALEACRAILTYAREELEMNNISVHISDNNIASIQLARKLQLI